jgi:hypothetical protein
MKPRCKYFKEHSWLGKQKCTKIIKLLASNYCNEHKCENKDCCEVKLEGFKFCVAHRCSYKNCPHEKINENDCGNHKCILDDCNNYKNDVDMNYCDAHRCTECSSTRIKDCELCEDCKCAMYDCKSLPFSYTKFCDCSSCEAVYNDTSDDHMKEYHSSYCREHMCGIKDDYEFICLNYIKCKDHTCKVEHCEEIIKHGNYCELHRCGESYCDNMRTNGELCDGHSCRVDNCKNKVNLSNEYCKQHECFYDSCSNLRKPGLITCEKHICAHDNCMNIVNYRYCKHHECIISRCSNGVYQKGMCEKHFNGIL